MVRTVLSVPVSHCAPLFNLSICLLSFVPAQSSTRLLHLILPDASPLSAQLSPHPLHLLILPSLWKADDTASFLPLLHLGTLPRLFPLSSTSTIHRPLIILQGRPCISARPSRPYLALVLSSDSIHSTPLTSAISPNSGRPFRISPPSALSPTHPSPCGRASPAYSSSSAARRMARKWNGVKM